MWLEKPSFVTDLEAKYPVIRQEFDEFYENHKDYFIHWRAKDIGLDGWDIIGLRFQGRDFPDNIKYFPKTWEILNSLPQKMTLAAFSRLAPGKCVEPHVGYDSNVWRGSLGIHVPDKCVLGVGSEIREMAEGRCLLFDDRTIHYAWNDSNTERVVLLFDFEIPGQTFDQHLDDRTIEVLVKMHKRDWAKIA